MNLRMNYGG